MKKSIYFNYIIWYIVFITVVLLLIHYIIEPTVYDYNKELVGNDVYQETYSIARNFALYDEAALLDTSKYTSELNTISYTTDSIIWISDADGNIIYSTDSQVPDNIIDELSSYFRSGYYAYGTFNGFFGSSYVSSAVPIVNNFLTKGYVIVSKSSSHIDMASVNMMNYIYVISCIILMISLSFLILFTFSTYRPLKKISHATKEYAKGNFDYDGLKINSHDEMGVLASNINFMAEEIKSIDDKQKKFIANCSHDFRSPLTSIKGYLEAMIDGTIPPELYDKYLNIVLSEAERLNRLTSSLLTINTWNNAGQALDLTDFDIVTIIRNTISSFEGQCNKKKITMDVTYGAKSYIVNADQVKIQQVLYNIIDNAIKFSHSNSTIFVNVIDKNDKVFISIKDTGIGIPKDSLNKIWDRFYKSDISRGKDKTGSGLGLSIAKEVITNHNENINVISTEGVGTEFIFTLHKSKKTILPI